MNRIWICCALLLALVVKAVRLTAERFKVKRFKIKRFKVKRYKGTRPLDPYVWEARFVESERAFYLKIQNHERVLRDFTWVVKEVLLAGGKRLARARMRPEPGGLHPPCGARGDTPHGGDVWQSGIRLLRLFW